MPVVARFRDIDWWLVGVIVIGLGLRLWRLPEMAPFDFDQAFNVQFARRVWEEFPIQMAGQGLSIQGLFMGPWYFYYQSIWLRLFDFYPIGATLGSILLGMITMIVFYFLGKEIWNIWTGRILAFLKAVLFFSVSADWSAVPSYSSELVVGVVMLGMWRYWQRGLVWWEWILLGLSLGMISSFHPILLPLALVVLVFLVIKRDFNWRQLGLLVLAGILPTVPLVMFDYFRKWSMVRQIGEMLEKNGSESSAVGSSGMSYLLEILAKYIADVWLFSWDHLGLVIIAIWFVLLGLLSVQWRSLLFHKFWLILCFLVFLTYYRLFPAHVPEYYLYGLQTVVLIYSGAMLGSLLTSRRTWVRYAISFLLLGLLVFNIRQLHKEFWADPSLYNLYHKETIVNRIKELAGDKAVYISVIHDPGWNFGFKELLDVYEVRQADFAEGNDVYTIVTPASLAEEAIDEKYGGVGLIYPD